MRKRTKAREFALQLLYQEELAKEPMTDSARKDFWEMALVGGFSREDVNEIQSFTHKIIAGVRKNLLDIDAKIQECADNWEIERMAVVDKNVLRLGVCEILFFDDIPVKVAINEAIELAKTYGDSESPRFVNGILDKIARKFAANKS